MPQRSMTKDCFFSPGKRTVIDIVANDGLSFIRSQTLAELRQQWPDVEVVPSEEAVTRIESGHITEAVEISREDFIDALEVLPPCRWKRHGDTESFYMSEFTYGSITAHYVRINTRYFHFSDDASLTHEDAVRKAMIANSRH